MATPPNRKHQTRFSLLSDRELVLAFTAATNVEDFKFAKDIAIELRLRGVITDEMLNDAMRS